MSEKIEDKKYNDFKRVAVDFGKKVIEEVKEKGGVVAEKTKEVGQVVVDEAKKGGQIIAVKAQEEQVALQKKIYNPVFMGDFDEPHQVPNMIVISDSEERMSIEVCEGAIGWMSTEKQAEVLHLYEECVDILGIQFIPVVEMDSIYYVDKYNKNNYIKLESYFDKARDAKFAELKEIAYSLGAKSFYVEMRETEKKIHVSKAKAGVKVKEKKKAARAHNGVDVDMKYVESFNSRAYAKATFEKSAHPKLPALQWFGHDETIKGLIKMRCNGIDNHKLSDYELVLDCKNSLTMSKNVAAKIDGVLKRLGIEGNFTMQNEVMNESRSVLIYRIEF